MLEYKQITIEGVRCRKVAEDKKKDLDELINKNLPEENNEEFMRTIAQSYIDEGIQKGIIQGIEKGKEEGREEGIEKGREEGIEKGIEKTKTETVMKMLKFASEISFIKDVTGLSEQEILKIKVGEIDKTILSKIGYTQPSIYPEMDKVSEYFKTIYKKPKL